MEAPLQVGRTVCLAHAADVIRKLVLDEAAYYACREKRWVPPAAWCCLVLAVVAVLLGDILHGSETFHIWCWLAMLIAGAFEQAEVSTPWTKWHITHYIVSPGVLACARIAFVVRTRCVGYSRQRQVRKWLVLSCVSWSAVSSGLVGDGCAPAMEGCTEESPHGPKATTRSALTFTFTVSSGFYLTQLLAVHLYATVRSYLLSQSIALCYYPPRPPSCR